MAVFCSGRRLGWSNSAPGPRRPRSLAGGSVRLECRLTPDLVPIRPPSGPAAARPPSPPRPLSVSPWFLALLPRMALHESPDGRDPRFGPPARRRGAGRTADPSPRGRCPGSSKSRNRPPTAASRSSRPDRSPKSAPEPDPAVGLRSPLTRRLRTTTRRSLEPVWYVLKVQTARGHDSRRPASAGSRSRGSSALRPDRGPHREDHRDPQQQEADRRAARPILATSWSRWS